MEDFRWLRHLRTGDREVVRRAAHTGDDAYVADQLADCGDVRVDVAAVIAEVNAQFVQLAVDQESATFLADALVDAVLRRGVDLVFNQLARRLVGVSEHFVATGAGGDDADVDPNDLLFLLCCIACCCWSCCSAAPPRPPVVVPHRRHRQRKSSQPSRRRLGRATTPAFQVSLSISLSSWRSLLPFAEARPVAPVRRSAA